MEGTIATRAGPSYVVPKRDWGGASAKAGTSALYRAPAREWAGLVQIVHGQSRQHSVVCVQAVVDEIIVPTTENDRRDLRKYGGIQDGNRQSVASESSAREAHSSHVRAGTQRARRRPGDSGDVLQPSLAPYDVGPGRDGHRDDVDSLERERQGNSAPRHESVAYGVRASRARRARRTSRACRSGGTCSSSCPWCSRRAWSTGCPGHSLRGKLQPEEVRRRRLRIGVRYEREPERTCIRYSVIRVVSECAPPCATVVDPRSQDLPIRVCG